MCVWAALVARLVEHLPNLGGVVGWSPTQASSWFLCGFEKEEMVGSLECG